MQNQLIHRQEQNAQKTFADFEIENINKYYSTFRNSGKIYEFLSVVLFPFRLNVQKCELFEVFLYLLVNKSKTLEKVLL